MSDDQQLTPGYPCSWLVLGKRVRGIYIGPTEKDGVVVCQRKGQGWKAVSVVKDTLRREPPSQG